MLDLLGIICGDIDRYGEPDPISDILSVVSISKKGKIGYNTHHVGVWRSLVAHLLGVQGAVGSNPATPTNTGD